MLERIWRVGCLMGALGVVTLVACGDGDDRQVCTGDACLGTTTGSGMGPTTTSGTGGNEPSGGIIAWGHVGKGNGNAQKAACTAQDSAGNVYLGGYLEGALGLGLGLAAAPGSADTFLVKLAPDGTPLWGFTFGVVARMEPTLHCGLAVDASHVYFGADIAGSTTVDATFGINGGGSETPDGNADLPVIVKLDPDGNYVAHTTFGGGAAFPWIEGLAVDNTGVYVTGTFGEFAGTFIDSVPADPSYHIYVGKFAKDDLSPLWSQAYRADANVGLTSVGIAANGTHVVTVGTFDTSNLAVDGNILVTGGLRDVVVVKHDANDGAVLATQQFTGASNQDGLDVALMGNGDAVVAGYYEMGIEFSVNDFFPASTTSDPFVTRLNGDLEVVWAKTFSGTGTNQMRQVEVVNDRIFVGGRYQSDLELGGAAVKEGQSNNAFIAELNPDSGDSIWTVTTAPDAVFSLYTMSASPVGVAFAGTMSGAIEDGWVVNGTELAPNAPNVDSVFVGFIPIE